MLRLFPTCAPCALLAILVACGGDAHPDDDGGGGARDAAPRDASAAQDAAMIDAAMMDAAMMDAAVERWPAVRARDSSGAEVDPDLSCLGARMAPVAGEHVSNSTPVVPFGAPPTVTLPGVPVRFFLGERASAECAGPECVATLADSAGVATAMLPEGAWVITEVPRLDGPDPMRSFMRTLELQWQVGREATFNTFNRGSLAAFEGVLGAPVDPTRGIAAGRVLDCRDQPLSQVRMRYYDESGALLDVRHLYFDGMLPPGLAPAAINTATDGRYAAIDVPPSAARAEAWGYVDDALTRLSCEPIQVEADTLSVLVMRPARSDGPAACRD